MIGVTGANGFIGRALVSRLVKDGRPVTAFVRDRGFYASTSDLVVKNFPDLDGGSAFDTVTIGLDVLIHCAARVHLMNDSSDDPLSAYLNSNCHATVNLARSAAKAGVKRFVFLSSIKVNGDTSPKATRLPKRVNQKPEIPTAYQNIELKRSC